MYLFALLVAIPPVDNSNTTLQGHFHGSDILRKSFSLLRVKVAYLHGDGVVIESLAGSDWGSQVVSKGLHHHHVLRKMSRTGCQGWYKEGCQFFIRCWVFVLPCLL